MMTLLRVLHEGDLVGQLAENAGGDIVFQCDGAWLQNGFDFRFPSWNVSWRRAD